MTTRSPIRTLRFVALDGATRIGLHVHCPMEQRSADLERCSVCPRAVSLDTVDAEGHRAIECNVEDASRARGVMSAMVGEVMRLDTACVASDAMLGDLRGLVPGRTCIVDETTGVLRGILDWDALRASPDDAWIPVTDAMAPAVQVREDTTLDDALRAMVRAHVRVLTVTRDDGSVVGLVDDLAILHWCAEHRGS
jgi:CBS domain-containing protein